MNSGTIVSRLKSKCTIGVILLTLCIITILGLASAQSDLQFQGNSGAMSSSMSCGQVVRGNLTLTGNLVCTGDGLIVGGDNTIINLNGYSINGAGDNSQKVGIAIPHSNNVIVKGPGTVLNFQAGILVTGGSSSSSSAIKEISQNHFVDKQGYVHVIGEIQNTGGEKVEFIKVNVAYYDSLNGIIGADFVYSSPHTLFGGQSATYNVLTSVDSLASPDVNSVKVRYEYQVGGETLGSEGNEFAGPKGSNGINVTGVDFEGNRSQFL